VPDTAIFLATQPTQATNNAAPFHGWIIRSMPGATYAGDAGETFRVIGCSQRTRSQNR
jgi:hypothetical protein